MESFPQESSGLFREQEALHQFILLTITIITIIITIITDNTLIKHCSRHWASCEQGKPDLNLCAASTEVGIEGGDRQIQKERNKLTGISGSKLYKENKT